jgi:hypothetical protein
MKWRILIWWQLPIHKLLKITTTITMGYVLIVTIYKGEFKKHNIDIDNDVEEGRWDYSNECNKWEWGRLRNTNPNRIEC